MLLESTLNEFLFSCTIFYCTGICVKDYCFGRDIPRLFEQESRIKNNENRKIDFSNLLTNRKSMLMSSHQISNKQRCLKKYNYTKKMASSGANVMTVFEFAFESKNIYIIYVGTVDNLKIYYHGRQTPANFYSPRWCKKV